MAEHTDASDRANALMRAAPTGGRRRRSFLASTNRDREPIAELPSLQADDDDLPVLTEIVVEEEEPAAAEATAPDRFDEALLSVVASDLVRSLEQQLAIELPTLIEASMLNAQNELRDGINSTLDMALRDFLARRQQLSLPLDDADHDR